MADTSIFDPVQAAKSGPLDLTDFSDQQLFQHLSDPAKFRAAIPDYAHLSDNDIRAGMQRTAARNPAYVAPSVPNPILKAAQMRTSLPGSAYGFATEKVDPNDPVQNALVGAGSAALQTMRRVKNVAEPAVGPLVQPFMELAEPAIPQSVLNYAAKKQADVTTATNAPVQGTAQKIGYTGEQIGEYLAAPESEIAAGVSKVLAPAAKYAPKLVAAGSRILASGATGGTVAALHGESPVKGAEYGAGGSLLNETLISPAMKYASQYLPARMMNWVMRTPTSGFNYGRDPGRRVAEEGYVAATKNSLLNKIGDGLKDAGQAIDTHLSDPAVDKPVIDLTNAIHEPIDKAKNIALAGGNQALYRNLEALEDGLTKSFGPLNRPNFTGVGHTRSALVPNANLPLSGFTPLEANRVKQFVGESARWNGDPQFDQLSPVKRQIYGRINDLVEQAAPGIKAINQKYGELLDAHQSLDHAIRLGQKYNPLGSLTEILAGVTHGLPAYAAMKAGRSTAGMTVAAQATRNLADLSELLRKSATGYAVSSPYDEHPAVQAAEKANPKMFAPRMTPEQAALQARLAAKLRK